MTRDGQAHNGAIPSPNVWNHPEVYELLEEAADPDGVVEQEITRLADPLDKDVVEIGVGTGFGLPWLASRARRVLAIEPHPRLAERAAQRMGGSSNVRVQQGIAQSLPLPDVSVDVVLARWAYFFGPGCEPGLAEARRVLRRGGLIVVTDVDATDTRPGYSRWFRAGFPDVDVAAVERFFSVQGFTTQRLDVRWVFRTRRDLEAVLGIEFPPEVAGRAAQEVAGLVLRCPTAVRIWGDRTQGMSPRWNRG